MLTSIALSQQAPAVLQIGFGFDGRGDVDAAVAEAASLARASLRGVAPDMALVITAGDDAGDPVAAARSVLGPVALAGGATTAILDESGWQRQGAVVVCMANSGEAASGVAAVPGRELADAAEAGARLILAGWPFRLHYPRGLGIAFARNGLGDPARGFLEAWRPFMGPKMRTICSTLSPGRVYGTAMVEPAASVACLEAPYSTGLGFDEGQNVEGGVAGAAALTAGAVAAAAAAMTRLEGRRPRLAMVVESAARHRALGSAVDEELSAIREELGDAPCLGWVCDRVAAYGRGVRAVDAVAPIVIAVVGDSPARQDRLT